VWVMNTKFWDGLTHDEKNVVAYSAKSAIVAGRGIAALSRPPTRAWRLCPRP